MESLRLYVAYLVLWAQLPLAPSDQTTCPSPCYCYSNLDADQYTYTVDCTDLQLTSFPASLPTITTHLDISGNYIEKVGLRDLKGLGNLVYLQLHGNLIAEIEPGSFSDLTSLQALFIYNNNIRELAAGALAGLGSLLELDAHNMHLESFAGGVFSPLSSAYYIDLSDNRLGTLPPNAFSGLPKLQTLILSGNFIQMVFSGTFTGLPSLKVLNLDDNHLGHIASNAFLSLPVIQTISLQMNQFVCDCDAVWLYGWLVKKGVAGPLCTYPAPLLGRPLLQLKPQDICRPPSVAMATPPYVVLNQSATLLLFCNASGAPPPKVHWSVNGFTFYPNDTRVTSNDTSLRISNVGVNDSGMYYCCASSGNLSVSSSVYVTVLDVVSENNISSIAAYVGTTAQVPCVIRPLPVPLPVTWMFQKNVLQASPKYTITANSTLLVNNTSLSDGGLYQCVVGGATVLMRRVTVIAPPTITRFLHGPCSSPQSISLNTSSVGDFVCDAFGAPPPSIQWLYNGAPLSNRTRPLYTVTTPLPGSLIRVAIVFNTTNQFILKNGSGNYTCVASNPYGSDVKSTLVAFVDNSTASNATSVVPIPILVYQNQNLTLACNTTSTWINQTLPSSSPLPPNSFITRDNSLFFIKPQNGVYTCAAKGGGGGTIRYNVTVHDPPFITKGCRTPSFTFFVGQGAWLPCTATGSSSPIVITWYKGGSAVPLGGRFMLNGTSGTLLISSAIGDDSGVYTCIASNPKFTNVDTYTLSLQIIMAPTITQPPTSLAVKEGYLAQLQCLGMGLPPPVVTWWKSMEGVSMATQVQPSSGTVIGSEYLVILRASVLDMGYYYCNLSSPVGVANSTQAYLNVYTAPVFMPSPSEVKTVEGTTSVSLPCPASSNPPPTITWYFQHAMLSMSDNYTIDPSGSLTVLGVSPQEGGVYTCKASNQFGAATRTVTLTVVAFPQVDVAPPTAQVKGSCQVTFYCTDHQAPPINYMWSLNGRRLTSSGHVIIKPMGILVIANTSRYDVGNYTCTVWNSAGTASSTAVLVVDVPMEPFLPSIISPTPSSQLIPETGTAQFVCVAMGDPPPSLVWMFNGGPIRNLIRIAVSQDTLTVQLLRSTDSGTYACIANNTHGTTARSFQLDVAVSPQFTEVPFPITLQEGRRLSLPCAAYGYPDPDILWFKDDRQLTSPVLDPSTQALQVYNTTPGDSGTYTCLARNFAGVIQYSVAITIKEVSVSPRIVAPPVSTVVVMGTSVALDCVVDGVPPPNVTWFKETSQLFSSGNVNISLGTLRIASVSPSDAGRYSCVAENTAGRTVAEAFVAVTTNTTSSNVFTMLPYFTTTPKDISAPLGSTLSLHCQANGSPTPQISWLFNNHPLLLFGSGDNIVAYDNGTLVITVLTRSDLGNYTCIAKNSVGQSQAVVTVTEATVFPQFDILPHGALQAYSGDNLTLDCGATGYPVPSIVWQRDGRLVDGSGQQNITITQNHSLVIQSLSPSQSGQYTCVAGSVVGVAYVSVQVEVVPRPPSPPTVTIPTPNTTVLAGAMVVLACQVDGWPTPLMSWFNGSTPVVGGDTRVVNGSLVFRRASVYDRGPYTCAALNINGVNEATVYLTVLPRPEPPFITHTLVDTLVVQGGYALFPCEATSYQGTPTIRWAFNGLPLVPSQQWNVLSDNSLLLTAVTLNDTGTYSCMASNQYGTSVANVTVWVLRTPINASVVALAGSGVQLTCNLTGTVVWTKDGNPVMTSSRVMLVTGPPQKLYILIVQSSDEGEYQCAGGGRFMGIFLQVTVKPTINTQSGFFFGSPGSTVMLPCQASGQPLPQLSWVWQGKPLQADSHYGLLYNGSLLVYYVGVADGGDYTCVAQNTAGTAQSTVTLVVL